MGEVGLQKADLIALRKEQSEVRKRADHNGEETGRKKCALEEKRKSCNDDSACVTVAPPR